MPTFSGRSVALIGKLGHGKTRLVNKVCGTHHVSQGGCRSATRTVELGFSKNHGIALLGTPGLGATEDVSRHIAAQKLALEFTPLSGIYIIVKCGRDGDMIDDQINDIIDMVGEEAVRIIVTHADVESGKEGFDEFDVKRVVSRLADISLNLIKVVGIETSGKEIEDFIHSTLLPQQTQIKLDATQVVRLASTSKQSRRISKAIRDIHGKIDAAAQYCDDLTRSGNGFARIKNYENDLEIMDLQRAAVEMVGADKERIFRDAVRLTTDEQIVCYAQAGSSLSIKLKGFVETTNSFLSWNVTDISDPRNHYRACPHCGAVFVKVEGCDGDTTCGAIPSNKSDSTSQRAGSAQEERLYSWYEEGPHWQVRRALSKARRVVAQCAALLSGCQQVGSSAVFEKGCGNTITWSAMHPIGPDLVAALGKVETLHPGTFEELSNRRFEADLQIHEQIHKENLKAEFN